MTEIRSWGSIDFQYWGLSFRCPRSADHRVKHKSRLIDKDDVTLMGEGFRAGHRPQVVRAAEGNNDLELAARSSLG